MKNKEMNERNILLKNKTFICKICKKTFIVS